MGEMTTEAEAPRMPSVSIMDFTVVAVRETADIQQVLAEYGSHLVKLDRKGKRYLGQCPICDGKSLDVEAKLGLWRCLHCGRMGDVIALVGAVENLDFAGAVIWLAARTGVPVHFGPRRRDALSPCPAHRVNGDPCPRVAGYGTDHRGEGHCMYHGGRVLHPR